MNENNLLVGILGYGEIGKAIGKFYTNPLVRDVDKNTLVDNLDVLHVCIPFIKNFHEVVSENIEMYNPKIVVVHSTVAVGETKKLFEKYKNVVHSPARGVHPNLYEGIKTFIKFVGADDLELGNKVAGHLREIGIENVQVLNGSSATELAKLLDTTYYGVCIAYHAYAADLCNRLGVSFDEVMTGFNQSYNEGYVKLGKSNVVRPVLQALQNNKIGGHCVVPNAEILENLFGGNELLSSILKYK